MAAKKPNDLLAAVEAARTAVADLKAQRSSVQIAPIPLSEARARIALAIERHAAEWRADAAIGVFAGVGEQRVPPAFEMVTLQPPMSVADPQGLEATLMREVEAYVAARGGEGLPSHERSAALAALDAEIFEAELAEEQAVAAAEQVGFAVLRRRDADPAAVLAVA